MTEREALYAAVLAAPDDDTPRLVFADYLDDTGDPADALRAEFIRAHCGMGRAEPWSPEWRGFRDRWTALHAAADRLGDKKTHPWAKHLTGRVKAWDYERGLIGHVTVFSKRFVAEGGRFFDDDPVRSVKFVTLTAASGTVKPAELFRCPHLARVARLALDGSELDARALDQLGKSPHLGSLRGLSLGGRNGFQPAALPKLLPQLTALAELRLTENEGITTAHVEQLAACPDLARLRILDLGGTGVGPAGVRSLATSPHAAGLGSLNLTAPMLIDEEHGHPTGYDRSRTEGLAYAEALAAGAWPSLTDLALVGRDVGDEGLTLLAAASFPALRRLTLAESGYTLAGLRTLAASPAGRRLWYLNLSYNPSLFRKRDEIADLFPDAEVVLLGPTP